MSRLARSTSPYLRQHADNPVDWYEWGAEALDRARAENKPILLSVGYSSCHWCHVMAHESFEDEATAAVMNERFINIKVDREERPDVDAIYQRVVQLMGQGGGWPLTVFLTPEQKPFYGGTYFPKVQSHGRPSFVQVLDAIDKLFREDPERVAKHTESFMEGFAELGSVVDRETEKAAGDPPPDDPQALHLAVRRLAERIDPEWGGFGRQPKFPNATALQLFAVLALMPRSEDSEALIAAAETSLRLTLEKMYRGGIYDHLRGGFARYSVDQVWLVPHFEKMLYDNALLLPLYAEQSALHPEREYLHRVVSQTVTYLEADMRTEDGTFYAATDADSEGVEGKYFCWTPSQVAEVLGDDALAELFCTVYDIKEGGNFEHGWSIANLPRSMEECAATAGLDRTELLERLDGARDKLLAHRYTRVPPHRDDKILTSWNALLVSGLARTASAMEVHGDHALAKRCQRLATDCLTHLLAHHIDDDGRVLRAAFEGRVHTRGVLDDVAHLGRACLDVFELDLDPAHLTQASRLAAHALAVYARPQGDGFFFTAEDAESLVDRTESQHDGPIPSGLGVMVELLLRLDAAEQGPPLTRETIAAILKRFAGATAQPFGYASLLNAARLASADAVHVTVRGPSHDNPQAHALARTVRSIALRSAHAVSISFAENSEADAIVCRGQTCLAPIADADALAAAVAS